MQNRLLQGSLDDVRIQWSAFLAQEERQVLHACFYNLMNYVFIICAYLSCRKVKSGLLDKTIAQWTRHFSG